MPKFLNTLGNSTLAIAVCDRCKMKRAYDDLEPDNNSPGLRVCKTGGCNDEKDPYRLPMRKPENITLRYPRPEEDIST